MRKPTPFRVVLSHDEGVKRSVSVVDNGDFTAEIWLEVGSSSSRIASDLLDSDLQAIVGVLHEATVSIQSPK